MHEISGSFQSDFVFDFNDIYGRKCTLTSPVVIPLQTNITELAYRLVKAHNIPCYSESVLIQHLDDFYAKELAKWYRRNGEDVIQAVQNESGDLDKLVDSWVQNYTEEHVAFAKAEIITNEEVFSEMYHTLIHSPALNSLLTQEHIYAQEMESLVLKKDSALAQLQTSQAAALEEEIKGLGITSTDERINALAVKQLEEIQMLESKWESEISSLRENQKWNFQNQVTKAHEEYILKGECTSFENTDVVERIPMEPTQWISDNISLEESFTIHLGAQLKQMHNLRLLSAGVLNLCHMKPVKTRNAVPHRLQTAMSLYSNNLCGLVLLVDSRVNSYTGIKREFARACQSSTEFHFESLEDQLESVRDLLHKVSSWRSSNRVMGEDRTNLPTAETQSPKIAMLRPGDVYVTRHSNLDEVHVVFHVVTDDSIRSGDISSRHPAILALRNVLKVACLCDITTVTMPLLLVHEMSEEMTMVWCLKRAELIYKCIKGFMIEMASWGGSESRNVQFLVPKGISDDLFSNLSTMLPSIFRMSNPLKIKL